MGREESGGLRQLGPGAGKSSQISRVQVSSSWENIGSLASGEFFREVESTYGYRVGPQICTTWETYLTGSLAAFAHNWNKTEFHDFSRGSITPART